jgi:NAD/NADP transhydrogenase beta subunit
MEIYEVVAIALGIVGAAFAFDSIDNWSQWVVLAAIIGTVIGFITPRVKLRRVPQLGVRCRP